MDYAGYQASDAPLSMVEKAEDDAGFFLPSVKNTVRQHLSGYISRIRHRYRRRMERIGRKVVGRPPEIDAGDWLVKQGAEAFFPSRNQKAGETTEQEEEEEMEEREKCDLEEEEEESDDDSFYEESDSDLEDLDEAFGEQMRNPAVEDCMDHYWNW